MKLKAGEVKRLLKSGDFMRGCDLKGITLPTKLKTKVRV